MPGAPQSRRQDGGPPAGSGLTLLGSPSFTVIMATGSAGASSRSDTVGAARTAVAGRTNAREVANYLNH